MVEYPKHFGDFIFPFTFRIRQKNKNKIKMRKSIKALLLISLIALRTSSCNNKKTEYGKSWTTSAIETAIIQLTDLAKNNQNPSLFPRTIKDGKVHYVDYKDWTRGFFPGSLWYDYELPKMISLKVKLLNIQTSFTTCEKSPIPMI